MTRKKKKKKEKKTLGERGVSERMTKGSRDSKLVRTSLGQLEGKGQFAILGHSHNVQLD